MKRSEPLITEPMPYLCKDCRFYLPIDVFTGICKITRAKLTPDDAFCDKAEKMPKCKFCEHFTPERNYLGLCMGNTLCYPDLVAVQCADFTWEKQP